MIGPGEYVPDPAEQISHAKDLPPAKVVSKSRNFRNRPCPRCGKKAPRHKILHRRVHDLGDTLAGQPRDLDLTYSQHRCQHCGHIFSANLVDLATPKAHYTHRVVKLAVRLVVEDGLPYRPACWHLWRDHRVFVPFATIQNWVEAAGEKSRARGHRR